MRNMWIAVAAVAILAVIALIVALVATRGGSDDDPTATPTLAAAPTETSAAATSTTVPNATATETAVAPTATEPPAPTATETPEPTTTPTSEPATATATEEPPTATAAPPTATPDDPTPTPTEAPATPTPQAGQQVYEANWTDGPDDWTLPAGWTAENGELVGDGSAPANLVAGFAPTQANYAIEAELTIGGGASCPDTVGLFARFVPVAGSETEFQAGYLAAVCDGDWEIASITNTVENQERLAEGDHQLDGNAHTYRFEVNGEQLRLFIDGEFIGEVSNDEYDDAGVLGLYVGGTYQVTVSSFIVFDL